MVFLTSSLGTRYYDGWQVTDNPFTGGVVRIETTNSSWMNGLYPAEYTTVLTRGTQNLLTDAGHSGRHFNSLISRVVGSFAVPPRPDDSTFVKYTLPAFELRRIVHEARQREESFELRYSHLPGIVSVHRLIISMFDAGVCVDPIKIKQHGAFRAPLLLTLPIVRMLQVGDEQWRISASDRTVTLVDSGKTRSCTVSVMDGKVLAAPMECTDRDLALAAFPSAGLSQWSFSTTVGLMQVWNSYPILNDSDTELHCYGS